MHPVSCSNTTRGFTLVELSIVLVIIGLLVGGIFAGQALIHSAALRSVTTEYRAYQSAFGAFKTKYDALPGDFRRGTIFWGALAGSAGNEGPSATCEAASPSAATNTCNGNGDGYISRIGASSFKETLYAWQHLSNAGFISGHYSGILSDTTNSTFVVGTDVPHSHLSPYAAWGISYAIKQSANLYVEACNNDSYVPKSTVSSTHVFLLGQAYINRCVPDMEALTVEDARTIDGKIDDASAVSGNVLALFKSNCLDANGLYRLSLTDGGIRCALVFQTGF